jgi:predicted TPR repeat methyltransferase
MLGDPAKEMLGEPLEDREIEAKPRELTLDEGVELAIYLQRIGQLSEAELLFSRVFTVQPDHPRALHYSGVLAHQLGRSEEGIALIERSLRLSPDEADWHNNFGIVLQERDQFDAAIAEYDKAIALDPGHANAYSNLGVLLRATGKPVEAEAALRTAIRLNPDHIDAYTNLGVLFNGLKRTDEAVICFCKVMTLQPKHREARRQLALAHCTLGEIDKAVEIFEEWLAEEPNDAIAKHMLSACSGRDVPVRASDSYVARTFDGFAASFESKLARLSYRAPALVAALLTDSGLEPSKSLDILDAGCGTGLCGPLVSPYARTLVGIDLSAGMLTQAKDKQIYDVLEQAELTAYLRKCSDAFDVIVSADTLVYFGALDEVMTAAAGALRAGGMLIFTLEHATSESVPDFRLETHGRYTHSQAYVERLIAGARLVPEVAHAELRMESGLPVAGLVIRARKPAAIG